MLAALRNPYVCLRCSFKRLTKIPPFGPQRRYTSSKSSDDVKRHHSYESYELPSIAPRPSIDIKHIRNNVELHELNARQRNYPTAAAYPARIGELFSQWNDIQSRTKPERQRLNKVQKTIGRQMNERSEEETRTLIKEARELEFHLKLEDKKAESLNAQIASLASHLPNLTSESTPIGDEPRLLSYINHDPESDGTMVAPSAPPGNPQSLSHADIGARLKLLDFTASSHTSGWGFYFLLNGAALLEQALIAYALHTCASAGFVASAPPTLTYTYLSHLTGFQPRDTSSSQIFTIEQPPDKATPARSLTATAEIPLAGSRAHSSIDSSSLPLKACAHSRCYRAEAGARGVDTKGLYRVHEFSKVEMFAWTLPSSEAAGPVLNDMMSLQTKILGSLDLKCRVLEMPSGDLGASANRKIDIEAFFPSRKKAGIDGGWGEVTSASLCTDYQSRRLETRLKGDTGGGKFPWTLNGTALAVPRVIAAIMENGYDEARGVVNIPEVLRKFMPGEVGEIGHAR